MSAAAVQIFHDMMDPLCGLSTLSVEPQEHVGVADHAVKPVDLAELSDAADNADIGAVYFGKDFGYLVFRQAEQIGRTLHPFVHSQLRHDAQLPSYSPQASAGTFPPRFVESRKCLFGNKEQFFVALGNGVRA